LRQRSLYQALMFAAFSLYWTAVPLALAAEHGLSQSQIALFALVGAVGRWPRRWPGAWRMPGMDGRLRCWRWLAPLALLLGLSTPGMSVIGLGLTVLLDFAVQMNMVIGQREVYALDPASRGRLNALYMTSIFLGGPWVRRWPAGCMRTSAGRGVAGRGVAGAGAGAFPGAAGLAQRRRSSRPTPAGSPGQRQRQCAPGLPGRQVGQGMGQPGSGEQGAQKHRRQLRCAG
jgi:hypothetical protein